jgi:phospholipase/carboxylesterase
MQHPHSVQPVLAAGAPLEQAHAAVIMVHGRGASAHDILTLAPEINLGRLAFLAPQAANNAWYPQRFIAPVEQNEPWLSAALDLLGALVERVQTAGIPTERIALLGFSQGACLALEYAARNPQRYGGLFALSGALIENGDRPRRYSGSLAATPAFLGCSDVDLHIPLERVQRSSELLRGIGADVTERIYPGMGHTVNADEIAHVRAVLEQVLAA